MPDLQRIWSSSHLPTLPSVAARLLDLVRDSGSTIDQVVAVLKTDPALSAKLVKAANSSYFGLRHEIKAVDRAVPLLGTTVSTSLALNFVLADDSMKRGPLAAHYRDYWKQSVVEAATAETLAKRLPDIDAGESFLLGLLLSIGRLAMLKTIPQEYLPVLEAAATDPEPLAAREQRVLGFDHVLVGAQLLEHWKLPASLVDGVRAQGLSAQALLEQRAAGDFTRKVVGAITAAVGQYFCATQKGQALERVRALLPLVLGTAVEPAAFLADCETHIQKTGALFDVELNDLGESTELMAQANEQLLQLTLREHASKTQAQLSQQALTEEKDRLEAQNRALQSQATLDPLTGLFNRKYLDEAVAREANRAQRQAQPIAVLFVDVDHFKRLNDTYGHPFGDHVLKQIAARVKESTRVTDILARYGGEEFVILVHQPTERGIAALTERIRARVAAEPFTLREQSVQVTCSLGSAIAIPGRRDRNIGDRLITAADQALYRAKAEGRNRVCRDTLISEVDREFQRQINSHRFSRWLVQQGHLEIPLVSRALLQCPPSTVRIGELAEQQGYLTRAQVDDILQEQAHCDERFGTIAVRLGLLQGAQLVHLLTLQHENPTQLTAAIVKLGLLPPDRAAAALEDYQGEFVPQPATIG